MLVHMFNRFGIIYPRFGEHITKVFSNFCLINLSSFPLIMNNPSNNSLKKKKHALGKMTCYDN